MHNFVAYQIYCEFIAWQAIYLANEFNYWPQTTICTDFIDLSWSWRCSPSVKAAGACPGWEELCHARAEAYVGRACFFVVLFVFLNTNIGKTSNKQLLPTLGRQAFQSLSYGFGGSCFFPASLSAASWEMPDLWGYYPLPEGSWLRRFSF